MNLIESLLNENRKLSLNKNRKRLKERAAETVFKKGDIVVAKDEFLDKGEEVKDTIGIVLDHKAENDYLQLGVLHPEDYAFPPIFNGRGEYYRLITDDERSKWIDNEVVEESKKRVKESSRTIPASRFKTPDKFQEFLWNSWGNGRYRVVYNRVYKMAVECDVYSDWRQKGRYVIDRIDGNVINGKDAQGLTKGEVKNYIRNYVDSGSINESKKVVKESSEDRPLKKSNYYTAMWYTGEYDESGKALIGYELVNGKRKAEQILAQKAKEGFRPKGIVKPFDGWYF